MHKDSSIETQYSNLKYGDYTLEIESDFNSYVIHNENDDEAEEIIFVRFEYSPKALLYALLDKNDIDWKVI